MKRTPTTRIVRLSGCAFALWLFSALPVAAQTPDNRLQSIETTALGPSRAEIILVLDSRAPIPSAFTVTNPARLSVDLPATELAVDRRYREVEAGPITGLTLAGNGDRTRLVVQLTQPVTYDITRDGNQIRIVVDAGNTANAGTMAAANRVTDIDFRRTAEGGGRIEITVSGVGGPIDINKRNGHIIATIPNTHLPENLEKRLDVLDFATPVKYVDIYARNNNTRVVVTPVATADYKRMAFQSGNQFILELQPVIETAAAEAEQKQVKPEFTGEELSLSFQKIDIRSVLQIIAEVAGVNMVVSDSVQGQITLQLENVPWDQALNVILRTQGLGMLRIGNVVTVAPLNEIIQRKNAMRAAQEAAEKAVPLQSRIIQINYAEAGDIASLLKSGTGETALLSERGRVSVDDRTNSLLVTDTAANLQEIRRVINELDVPIRQVLIEARIVVANRSFSRSLGVTASGNDLAAIESSTGGNYLVNTGFTVNLPIAGAAGTLTTSIIGDTFSLDLALQALETENRGEIISAPRVITTDGKEAVIEQGQEVPFTTQQGNDSPATTSFKEVVLNLTVTPHITPNEHVLLQMELTQDNVSGRTALGEPIIDTRSLTTQVLVDNGNTVVLGGIYQRKETTTENQIPFLGDLPLIGPLFSNTSRQHEKLELLIFITPTILQETLTER